ncbi:MAG TPA: hypothetical protein VFI96_07270, partial [Longimicrobiaceae bacterium]|nr:hypothetical protein [Longimicrobiaceae bacterium]
MKDLSANKQLGRVRSAAIAALLLSVGSLSLAGCTDDQVHQLDAQSSDSVQTGPQAAPKEPAFAPADTASRRVGDALSEKPDSAAADSIAKADSVKMDYRTGEDPAFARKMGWPVDSPEPLPGALLPEHRIVAYYGNPLSSRMGVLGEYPKDKMLQMLKDEVAKWNKADPDHPVVPALQMIVSVAQGGPGSTGKYRMLMWDTTVERIHSWAKEVDGVFFIDIQTGLSTIQELLPEFDNFLKQPDVHLAVDPEFMMVYSGGATPGEKIGSIKVSDINYITDHVAQIVRENHLPPKVVVIHRFTRNMVLGDTKDIILRPEVQ